MYDIADVKHVTEEKGSTKEKKLKMVSPVGPIAKCKILWSAEAHRKHGYTGLFDAVCLDDVEDARRRQSEQ